MRWGEEEREQNHETLNTKFLSKTSESSGTQTQQEKVWRKRVMDALPKQQEVALPIQYCNNIVDKITVTAVGVN